MIVAKTISVFLTLFSGLFLFFFLVCAGTTWAVPHHSWAPWQVGMVVALPLSAALALICTVPIVMEWD